jgi:hypothetical protein
MEFQFDIKRQCELKFAKKRVQKGHTILLRRNHLSTTDYYIWNCFYKPTYNKNLLKIQVRKEFQNKWKWILSLIIHRQKFSLTMKPFSMIVALGPDLALGYQNGLPWKLKQDLQYFK